MATEPVITESYVDDDVDISNGYDPIVGVQPDNPTDVMTFSMVARPKLRRVPGRPANWRRVAFEIKITSYRFTYWNGRLWKLVPGPNMPFKVDPSVKGSSGIVAGNRQFVIPLGTNKKYRGPFPACIEVTFRTTLPDQKGVSHTARAVRFK